MPDLMARHVMVRLDGSPYFIDLARIRFRSQFFRPGSRSAARDLARLSATLRSTSASSGDRIRFIRAYVSERGGSAPRSAVRPLTRLAFALERAERKRRRFPDLFQMKEVRSRDARCAWNALFSRELENLGLNGPGDFRAPPRGASFLRDTGDRKNFRLGTGGSVFYLKVHEEKEGKRPPSMGRREWDNHLRLMRAGVPVPMPAAWGMGPGYSFFMSKACAGVVADDPALRWKEMTPSRQRRLAAELARRIMRMHRFGYFHRDLYLCHVVVDGEQVAVIDLQRLEDGPRFSGHRRIKDLAALLYSSLDGPFSRTDRLRFFKVYMGGGRLQSAGKKLLWAVQSKTRRIQAREDRKNGVRAAGLTPVTRCEQENPDP
jgi:heptose I phosphotransferase